MLNSFCLNRVKRIDVDVLSAGLSKGIIYDERWFTLLPPLTLLSSLLWTTISPAHHFLTTSDCKFLILNQVDTNIIGLHPFDDPDDGDDDDDPVDNSPFWWWLMSGVSWEELPNRSGRSNIVSDLHCSSLLQWLLSNHNNVDNTIRITGHSWNILRQLLEYVDCGSNCGQLPCCHTVHCTLHCTLYTPGL